MAPPVVDVAPRQRRVAAQDQQIFGIARLRRPAEIVAAGDDDGVGLLDIDQQHLVVRGRVTRFLPDRNAALLPLLAEGGIPVWQETRYAAAHNKVLLIDIEQSDPVVITGSYNFSWSAQARNAENLLILRGNPALARRYLDNWQRHRSEAEKMNGTK